MILFRNLKLAFERYCVFWKLTLIYILSTVHIVLSNYIISARVQMVSKITDIVFIGLYCCVGILTSVALEKYKRIDFAIAYSD